MPRNRSPATSTGVVESSTTALGCAATAAWVTAESWLPRTQTYGVPIVAISST